MVRILQFPVDQVVVHNPLRDSVPHARVEAEGRSVVCLAVQGELLDRMRVNHDSVEQLEHARSYPLAPVQRGHTEGHHVGTRAASGGVPADPGCTALREDPARADACNCATPLCAHDAHVALSLQEVRVKIMRIAHWEQRNLEISNGIGIFVTKEAIGELL